MVALPNATVPLFQTTGAPTSPLREILTPLGDLPRGPLVDANGRALPTFRNFLSGIVTKPLPSVSVQLADKQGRGTRAMTMLMASLP